METMSMYESFMCMDWFKFHCFYSMCYVLPLLESHGILQNDMTDALDFLFPKRSNPLIMHSSSETMPTWISPSEYYYTLLKDTAFISQREENKFNLRHSRN